MVLALDDTVDPLRAIQSEAAAARSWQAAYRRAAAPHTPRELRVFAWRLLHGGLPCGGVRTRGATAREQCACVLPACRGDPSHLRPATLAHTLLECPAAADAWAWFAQLWQRLQPEGQQPPLTARVLLLDDAGAWSPPHQLGRLWTRLRLGLLHALWQRRDMTGGQDTRAAAEAAVHMFLAKVRSQIRLDWRRCSEDVRLNSGVPLAWLAGRQPTLARETFEDRWCAGGVLVRLQPAGRGWDLVIRC